MKALLLDTCALIWLALGRELTKDVLRKLGRASEAEAVYVCPITAWEIATLVRKGRLSLGGSSRDFVDAAFTRPGVRVAAITPEIACAAGELPDSFPGDPADRIIAATALALQLCIVTRDRSLLEYAGSARLGILPC